MSDQPDTAYTDAPRQHPNFLLGSLHLLFWLFVHPSAWRNHVARIDPTLSPDFALLDLDYAPWRNRALARMMAQIWLVLPFFSSIIVWLILFFYDQTTAAIAFGSMIALSFGVAAGLPTSVVGGVAIGAAVTTLNGAAFGIGFGVENNLPSAATKGIAHGMASGLTTVKFTIPTAIGIILMSSAFGMVGSISATQKVASRHNRLYSITRRVGGISAGVSVGIIAGVIAFVVSTFLADAVVRSDHDSMIIGIGMFVGAVGSGAGALAGIVRTRKWGLSGVYAALGIPGFALLIGLLFSWPMGNNVDIFFGIVYGISCSLVLSLLNAGVFGLPMMIARRIAGVWAGAIAGAISASGFWALTALAQQQSKFPMLALAIAATTLGLTVHLWRPVLFYPPLVAYNLLLQRLDQSRKSGRPALLRYHAAFWDEHQRLRWPGLDEHIVLVAQRCPSEARAAINYLVASTGQRWAAQAAQIELDALALERCVTAADIGAARTTLAAGELQGPASALLRSFSRISQDVAAALEQERAYTRRLALIGVEERIDGLLRELTRSSERYALRFQPIAARWREIIAEHARLLAAEAEHRQEIDNPYVIGVPLTAEQSIFVGRSDICARIEQLLLDRRRPPLLLYGQRRMGKTSLLNNLGRLLPTNIVPLFVDLQGPAAQADSAAGFLYYLARNMRVSAERERGISLPELSKDSLERDAFIVFDEWLTSVEETLGNATGLLILDEFEVLDRAFQRGRFEEEAILGMLRHIIQHRPRCKVLLAGSHGIDEFRRWSSYLINVQVVQIGYLAPDEACKLIENPVKDFALRYTPDASKRVLSLTRGHPFLVQLLCAEVVALKNEQTPALRRLARIADIEAAVEQTLDSGDMFFADIAHNQIDADGRRLLRQIALHGEGALVERDDLAQSVADVDSALEQLLRRALIEQQAGNYRVQVELIRRWFAR